MGPIAKPLASKKLTKRLLKVGDLSIHDKQVSRSNVILTSLAQLVKNSSEQKRLRRGVREVVKSLRKNQKGVVLLAGEFECVILGYSRLTKFWLG